MPTSKENITGDPNFKILFENLVLVAGHVFETAYCFNKLTKEQFGIFKFENDPTCAIAGNNNDWCLIGGDVLVLHTSVDYTLRIVGDLQDIFGMKRINDSTIQVLTDPWSKTSAIWQLEIDMENFANPVAFFKVRNFTEYLEKEYSETIDW